MNTHERMEGLADVYVAGGLGAEERREAEQHAASCVPCAALLRDASEFSKWARGAIAPDAPPADLEDRLIVRFRAAGQTKKRRFPVGKRVLKLTSSVAAAVGLIVLGNVFSLQQNVSGDVGRQELRRHSDGLKAYWSKLDGDGPEGDDRKVDLLSRAAALAEGVRPPAGNELAYFFKRDLGGEGRDKALSGFAGVNGLAKGSEVKKLQQMGYDTLGVGGGGGGGGRYGGRFGGKEAAAAESEGKTESSALGLNRLEEKQQNAGRTNLVARGGGARAAEPAPVEDARKIIRTGDVSLEVESYDATYTKLAELINAEKGQITSANTQKLANGKIRATVILRILPERFEAVLAKLKEFGTIQNQTIGSQDVTKAYIDLETRLKSKEILAERLRKLLAEAKGNVKELMEVEVQLGATNEAIEQIKGEVKYYDNQIGLSTITLRISEKDLGQPFEYVQSLQSNIGVTAMDPDDAYAKAQKEITDAGGQIVDSKMTRQSDGSSVGTVRARVDAEKFPALRDALRKLGTVTHDTVNQQKTAKGGNEGTPKPDAPLRKELAVVDLAVSSPPLFVTRRSQILVETGEVESAYQNSRRAIEAAGGSIVDGSLTGHANGMSATLRAQVDAVKFQALVDSLKTAGKVKNANVNVVLPALSADGRPQLLRERAEIELALVTPPQLIGEEHGILKTIKDTFANSWTGLLWSVEKLFVGIALAGPWIVALGLIVVFWRRRRKAAAAAPQK